MSYKTYPIKAMNYLKLTIALTALIFSYAGNAAEAVEKKPNILLICIDDLRPELPSFGKDYIHAPNMEKLFTQGRLFKRHYVQAPTCGASRCALLTGIYPDSKKRLSNNAIAAHDHHAQPSFPAWFKSHGYTTVAVGKVSHYPGGNMGKNWDDATKPEMPNAWTRTVNPSGEWKHAQGLMHGYANGKGRERGKTPAIEALENARYPDDAIMDPFKTEFESLAKQDKPWLLAVGLLRPHLPFACEKKFLDLYDGKTIPNYSTSKPGKGEEWHGSGEFNGGYKTKNPNKDTAYAEQVRKHYAACVSSTDRHVGEIIKMLENSGKDKNTIVILWGDHGWHLGEKQIWGKHTLYEVALHSPLFIKTPGMVRAGEATNRVVGSVDIYPTLCTLAGLPSPERLQGTDLNSLLKDPKSGAKNKGIAISYWRNNRSEITSTEHKIFSKKDNKLLQHYDLQADPKELNNLIK